MPRVQGGGQKPPPVRRDQRANMDVSRKTRQHG